MCYSSCQADTWLGILVYYLVVGDRSLRWANPLFRSVPTQLLLAGASSERRSIERPSRRANTMFIWKLRAGDSRCQREPSRLLNATAGKEGGTNHTGW